MSVMDESYEDTRLNVVVIVGHPRKDRLCGGLAAAFVDGASKAGVSVRELWLADLDFDLTVHRISPAEQPDEADLMGARELSRWADHLVFVYPNWWGTMPALMKGFFDRMMIPGLAFADKPEGGWDKLLKGKTAQLITTMDMPGWVYRLFFRQPGNNAMKRSTLGFSGIRTTRILNLGPVKDSSKEQRDSWLDRARYEGLRLKGGVLSSWQRTGDKIVAWIRALRLQFYPLTWVAYTAGALAANPVGQEMAISEYWLGYAVLFFLEVATVLSNEVFDYETDRRNTHYGPFNGGSRVLVDKLLSLREVRWGIGVASTLALGLAGALLALSTYVTGASIAILAAMFVIAPGYTVPPLKFVYRGLGELDVGVTHSFGVLLCVYIFQGGSWTNGFPWIISVPLFFSILPAIILSSIPDYDADLAASKKTVAVVFGPKFAIASAMIFTFLASALAVVLHLESSVNTVFGNWVNLAVIHGMLLIAVLYKYMRRYQQPTRIDGLMVSSLSFTVWFGVMPLINLS